jgi:hypothetical protein
LDHDIAPNANSHLHPQTGATLCVKAESLDVAHTKAWKALSDLADSKHAASPLSRPFKDSLHHAGVCDSRCSQSRLFQSDSPSHCHCSHARIPPTKNIDSFSKNLERLDELKRPLLEHV